MAVGTVHIVASCSGAVVVATGRSRSYSLALAVGLRGLPSFASWTRWRLSLSHATCRHGWVMWCAGAGVAMVATAELSRRSDWRRCRHW
jgi:hypothetical protein